MKRILAIVVPLVLIALVAVVYFGLQNLDGLVKDAIQGVGSELVGTDVRVSSVAIDLREGRGTIRDLRIANPEGFTAGDAIRLGEITLAIDVKSVTSSPIVLDEVTVLGPQVSAEVTPAGINLDVLRKNLERASASDGSAEAPAAESTGGAGEPVRILIRKFRFADGKIASDATAVGGDQKTLELPSLVMNDVGGPAGATPAVLGEQLIGAWLEQAATTVGKAEARGALDKVIDDNLGKGADAAKKALDSLFE